MENGEQQKETPFIPPIQTKLNIGKPGDVYEVEADKTADEVVNKTASPDAIQKMGAEEEEVQAKPLAQGLTLFVQKQEAQEEESVQTMKEEEEPVQTMQEEEETVQAKEDEEAVQAKEEEEEHIQTKCGDCEKEEQLQKNENEEEEVQLKPNSSTQDMTELSEELKAARGSGHAMEEKTRTEMSQAFGANFSNVRIHTDEKANRMNKSLHAQAFTNGNDIYFNSGKYDPNSKKGKHLLAHELTHVVQQTYNQSHIQMQRQAPTSATSFQRLNFRPSPNGEACACLIFIHNNERNARRAAENLHRICRFNLAIVDQGSNRRAPIPGATGTVDPNELFPQSIQEECQRAPEACRRYVSLHSDLRAMQMQYFLTLKRCSNNFTLPTIALHNNTINDTENYRERLGSGESRRDFSSLEGDFERDIESGEGSMSDLRSRLGSLGRSRFTRMMRLTGTTNIFRWCNAPEISKCHIGDPNRPDFVVWTTNEQDYESLRTRPVNVALQDIATGESTTDLSSLFLRLGPDARYINIETPHTRSGTEDQEASRQENMVFIIQILRQFNLNCCTPGGDSESPS